jgi:hypothetical protein
MKVSNLSLSLAPAFGALLFAVSISASHGQVWSYDFNSQWNGDFSNRDSSGAGNILNYSKTGEGRLGAPGGNTFGGSYQMLPGYVGSVAAVYTPTTFNLSSTGSKLRIQESWSAFASQDSYATTGSSQVAQIGFISNDSGAATATLLNSDSVYFGVVERFWSDQTDSSPLLGAATLELGMFQDGAMVESFGTIDLTHYGARIGSEIYATWLEFDILFENVGNNELGYKVGVNKLTFYTPDVNTGPITEGTTSLVGIYEGVLATPAAGLGDLSNLKLALGGHTANTDVSVTGTTYDFSTSNIHDGATPVPEPSAMLFTSILGFLGILRRRR